MNTNLDSAYEIVLICLSESDLSCLMTSSSIHFPTDIMISLYIDMNSIMYIHTFFFHAAFDEQLGQLHFLASVKSSAINTYR